MNSIVVIGNIGRDPELKSYQTKDGKTGNLVGFSVAVQRRFSDDTDWFNCTAFGKTAENIAKYFHKGDKIGLRGSMQNTPYEKDGVTKDGWKLMIEEYEFCNSKSNNSNAPDAPKLETPAEIDEDDIPF